MRIQARAGNAFLAFLLAVGCAPAKKKDSGTVTITLDRATTGADILVTAHVVDPDGNPVVGSAPSITADGGSVSAVTDAGGGDYTATITPDVLDTEVPIHASAGGATVTKTALALGVVDANWGQPEAVDGLVNSGGWEDGADVSPDGQWLLVSSYVPVDLLSCTQDGGTDSTPSCLAITGPTAAPARPDMFGAERVHGSTYDSICPDLGITSSIGIAIPPVGAFGFHRQADGSFAEPFYIGFDADGCLAPYGYFLVGSPAGTSAAAVFAQDDAFDNPDTHSDVAWTPLTMGQKNVLATYRYDGSSVTASNVSFQLLPPILPTRQGNPAYGDGALWWDDEDLAAADRDLYFAPVTGTLPNLTAGSALTAAISTPGVEDIQPSLDGDDLYWMRAGTLATATLTSGADPSLAGSWSPITTIAGASAPNQTILALGEPNAAHVNGVTELYFVYVYKRSGGGYDANLALIRHR